MKEVDFNNNPDIIVFKEGIYDARNGSFGPSDQDDYINDDYHMGVTWEERDDEKISFVEIEQLQKLLPNDTERKSFLSHLSTGFHGSPFRGACFNLGPSCKCNKLTKNNNKKHTYTHTKKKLLVFVFFSA